MSDRFALVRNGEGRRIAVPGNTLRVLFGGEQTGDAYALIEFEFAPGFAVPIGHAHEREDELVVVLAGELDVTVGEHRERLGPGDALLKPSGTPHTMANAATGPTRFLEISSPAGMERYFTDLSALIAGGMPLGPAPIIALMRRYGITPAAR
jgi:uncharacterized cupin superfamily protein